MHPAAASAIMAVALKTTEDRFMASPCGFRPSDQHPNRHGWGGKEKPGPGVRVVTRAGTSGPYGFSWAGGSEGGGGGAGFGSDGSCDGSGAIMLLRSMV